jgi:hypothetical protein
MFGRGIRMTRRIRCACSFALAHLLPLLPGNRRGGFAWFRIRCFFTVELLCRLNQPFGEFQASLLGLFELTSLAV